MLEYLTIFYHVPLVKEQIGLSKQRIKNHLQQDPQSQEQIIQQEQRIVQALVRHNHSDIKKNLIHHTLKTAPNLTVFKGTAQDSSSLSMPGCMRCKVHMPSVAAVYKFIKYFTLSWLIQSKKKIGKLLFWSYIKNSDMSSNFKVTRKM